jgi:hypothetical protein
MCVMAALQDIDRCQALHKQQMVLHEICHFHRQLSS